MGYTKGALAAGLQQNNSQKKPPNFLKTKPIFLGFSGFSWFFRFLFWLFLMFLAYVVYTFFFQSFLFKKRDSLYIKIIYTHLIEVDIKNIDLIRIMCNYYMCDDHILVIKKISSYV